MQQAPDAPAAQPAVAPGVVVTATRSERNAYDLPVSIDRIDSDVIQDGRPMINLSETLPRVPGVVVLNRQNYAQDLQISSRGYGARTQFGVRGIRLYQDGIPATSPDGQGQTSNFDLATADRVEVMRGPFSALYGNSSGGVIQLFTADGPPVPTLSGRFDAGSYGTSVYGLTYGGQEGPLNYIGDVSRFQTDGYRDHSAAQRDLGNAKFGYRMSDDTSMNLVFNTVSQPAQDPQGLSRQQYQQNPRQVDPSSILFDTKKAVRQDQVGSVIDKRLSSADSLRFLLYGGDRQVQQYLSIPLANQTAPGAAGGIVDLDRNFYGYDLRWTRAGDTGGRPFGFSLGTDYDYQLERRRGYINNNGAMGDLKRDENDKVWSASVYAQGDWKFAPGWSANAGFRYTQVSFYSTDYYIVPGNPNDSGGVTYNNGSPALGLLYEVSPTLNLYANVGKGFETPTFAELAYKPDGTSGLNFALQPSTSINTEIGVKAFLPGGQRLTLAAYHIDTRNEIVVASATGGRNTYKNASRTGRDGAELSWSARVLESLDLLAAFSVLDARYRDTFTTVPGPGQPAITVPAGNYLPGVPRRTFYTEANWKPAGEGFSTAVEVRYSDRIYASDANAEWADPYTIVNWRAVFEQRAHEWKISEFVRVENLFDKGYIGSVIVGDSNKRYFEPAPARNAMVGISASLKF